MELAVSCTLEGRDLAIVKSIININNIYGDLNLTYVDDISNSQVLIAKQTINGQKIYFAEDLGLQKKYVIKPDLNPKTVRAMFEFLGNSMQVSTLERTTQTHEITGIHQFILQHAENHADKLLHITHKDFSIIIDELSQIVSADVELTDDLLKSFSNNQVSGVQYEYHSPPASHFRHEMNLATFKWNLGYFQDRCLIDHKLKSRNRIFRLLSWPNFGSYRFDQEFIRLCSLLWKHPEDYEHLLNISGYEKRIVNKFLNATIMTGMVNADVSDTGRRNAHEPKNNHFIKSLKSFFGFK
jgi:hypothetical protein